MFDMMNDIEDCPPTLLSSQRHFIAKCDVRLMIQSQSSENKEISPFKDYLFTFMLFTDLLILCKKRSIKRTIERTSSLKGPNNYSNSVGIKKNCKKEYKHIETIELSYIKFIQNDDSEGEFDSKRNQFF
ncbi:unnamed protein product [Oppiella nova]|uniref:ECT2 PH domain-containing protein n=1 Tax=Oppiella nova TaxID=334625 RepID=A0A7R9LPI4_9ACAR|nr:unnamed protein product [Oppiella nova]CAG2165314.1 unnamed protein product [Oppiella nova]